MWLLWKDEDNEWQQAVRNGLITSRLCLQVRDGGRAWGTMVQGSGKQTANSGLHYDFLTLRSLFGQWTVEM